MNERIEETDCGAGASSIVFFCSYSIEPCASMHKIRGGNKLKQKKKQITILYLLFHSRSRFRANFFGAKINRTYSLFPAKFINVFLDISECIRPSIHLCRHLHNANWHATCPIGWMRWYLPFPLNPLHRNTLHKYTLQCVFMSEKIAQTERWLSPGGVLWIKCKYPSVPRK